MDSDFRSLVFDSLGVSQGNEPTQEYAIHLFVSMFPRYGAALAERVQTVGLELKDSAAIRAENFAGSNLHAMTGEYPGGRRPVRLATTWLREAVADVQARPVSKGGIRKRALYLGAAMARRDVLSAKRGHRGKGRDPSKYDLFTADYNSHFLHYAYIENPRRIPDQSLLAGASLAARSLAAAIEKRDVSTLRHIRLSRVAIDCLRIVVPWHLSHYPAHQTLVPEAFMTNLMDDDFRRRLPTPPNELPAAQDLPRH